ncbi:MAG: hypothetical protein WA945_09605 [Arcobacteraceae bacterium]
METITLEINNLAYTFTVKSKCHKELIEKYFDKTQPINTLHLLEAFINVTNELVDTEHSIIRMTQDICKLTKKR